MAFDLKTAIPAKETETNDLQTQQFDISTARPALEPTPPEFLTGYGRYKKQEMDEQIKAAVLQPLSFEDTQDIVRAETETPNALWAGIIPYVKGVAGFFTRPFGVEPFGSTFTPEELIAARGEHPVASTIGEIIGGITPFIATAPLFPQSLIGTIATFGTVAGVQEVGEQVVEKSIMTPPTERILDITKEVGRAGIYAPIWYYSGALSFVGRPYASALTRAGIRGTGAASLSKVFGADLETALREGGMITALSLIFEAPALAKTALGRGIVKNMKRVAVESGVPKAAIDINVDVVDAVSMRSSLFSTIRAFAKSMKMKGRVKAKPPIQQKFLEVQKPIDIAPKGPPVKIANLTPLPPETPLRTVGRPEFEVKPKVVPKVKPPVEVPPEPVPAIRPYTGLIPGTEEWMEVWKEHPELQEEMLAYQKKIEPALPKRVLPTEVVEVIPPKPVTPKQIRQAHVIAGKKFLISERGKMKPQYRFLAKQMTGKRSMKDMTQEEARFFIKSLEGLVTRPGKPPKIPRIREVITQEFAEKISGLQEIGLKERIRPAHRVLEKIGLRKEVFEPAFEAEIKIFEELKAFRKDALAQQKTVGRTVESSRRIFRAIEQTLTKEDLKAITSEERKVAEWGRKFFDEWADRLKLPPEKRRKNYVTHIFEAEVQENLKTKYPLDPDLVRAMEFITPKTVFNPFLQKRLGKTIGLKEDFWSAIEAYEARQLKVFHYEPLIKRIRVYEKFLPPNSARYLRNFVTRVTNRPLVLDRELKQDFKELAGAISKLPQGDKLAEVLTRGNVSGVMAYNFTGTLYEMFLGLRPASAIKNLSQNALTVAEVGAGNFVKGKVWKVTKEGKAILKQSLMLRSRKLGFLPGVDETFLKGLESSRRKVTLAMFKWADRENVENAFSAGYTEAKSLGLPRDWAMKRGDEVAAKTQFIYSKFGGAMWSQSAPGRVLSVLTTWPINWLELMVDFGTGKPSEVYKNYEKATGKKITPESWLKRRKQLLRYMLLVSLAMIVERKTRLRALFYTGFTSLRSLANMAKGQFAGLDIPGTFAQLIAGLATGDKKMIKAAWTRIRPDRMIIIVRELTDIMQGKKDWLNLFFLLEKESKPKREIIGR